MKTIILIIIASAILSFTAGFLVARYNLNNHSYDRQGMDRLMADLQFEPHFYIDTMEVANER